MKNIGAYIGSFLPAGIGVTQMSNFYPLDFIFWMSITGIFIFSMIGAAIGMKITETKKKKNQWNGIGQIHLKPQ